MKWIWVSVLLFISFGLSAQTITTFAGCGTGCISSGDGGPATAARTDADAGGAFDKYGNFYFVEVLGQRVRKVTPSGIIFTIAGTGSGGYSGDGIPATATEINGPVAVVLDTMGNIYIDDVDNFRIRKVDRTSGIISTIAGNGTGAFYGEGVPAISAEIWDVDDMCIDKYDNLYLADHYNYRVRKIDTKGIITTIAGNGGFTSFGTGDGGPATAATFNLLYGIAVDDTGNIFVSDYGGGHVRKIDTFGIITNVAGNGVYTYIGDGMPATNAQLAPGKLTFDPLGNLVIADPHNNRVYQIDHSGILHTIAGNGTGAYSGDGGSATAAELWEPAGITYDACGNLYIAESSNKRVRKVTYPPILTIPTISLSGIISAAVGSTVTVTATVANAGSSYLIHWINHGTEFTTTTVPSVSYTKGIGIDTITARVVSTATYGCYDSATSAGHVVSDMSEGTSPRPSPGEREVLRTYPNPASNQLNVIATCTISDVTIYNVVGQIVLNREINEDKVIINIAQLPAGVYFVKVNGIYVQKFVKQ